jgi:hypothetical protein
VRKQPGPSDALVCSFCHRSGESVGKLISSPGDPRAYICDDCIATCNAILEDDQPAASERCVPHHPMENPNRCDHMWQGDFLWVKVAFENPATQKPNEPVEYVPLERCIHCGLLRLADDSRGAPDLAS